MGLTTSEAITSLAGQMIVDSDAISDLSLIAGLDLPDDWALSTTYQGQGILQFSASGTTAVSGADLELFRLLGAVNADSLYGSSSLVRASVDMFLITLLWIHSQDSFFLQIKEMSMVIS